MAVAAMMLAELSMEDFFARYGTLQEYYESLTSAFLKEGLKERYLVNYFVRGLPSQISYEFRFFSPKTISDACHLAKLEEKKYQLINGKTNPPSLVSSYSKDLSGLKNNKRDSFDLGYGVSKKEELVANGGNNQESSLTRSTTIGSKWGCSDNVLKTGFLIDPVESPGQPGFLFFIILFFPINVLFTNKPQESLHNSSNAGSTASVVLRLNHKELLVANVGNSKVILCAGYAEELTSDYQPDRDYEVERIEGAGAFVRDSDVPRVNGILARSQAIGDASVKKFGVTVEPEMVGWRNITAKDRFLVVASAGIFESLTPENVCRLVEDANVEEIEGPYDDCPIIEWIALTHYVVSAARKKGSTEDLSVIVVPLAQAACDAKVHNDEL